MRILLALLSLLIATPGLAAPDWTRTVTLTPDGAYVLGNPKSPRLVEYVSYTCSHCAHFVAEASGPLVSGWVRKGLLSLEVRHAIRDPYDLAAALLARCGGRARFFGDHAAIFTNQSAWMPRIMAYDSARGDEKVKSHEAVLTGMADGTGLTELLAKRGLPAARQHQCLANKAEIDRMTAMANEAWNVRKISGTPAFVLDGRLLGGVSGWDGLRPRLPTPAK